MADFSAAIWERTLLRLGMRVVGFYLVYISFEQISQTISGVLVSLFDPNSPFKQWIPGSMVYMAFRIMILALGAYLLLGGRWLLNRIGPPNGRQCSQCGYDLTGAPGPRCPECGTSFGPRNLAPQLTEELSPPPPTR